MASLAPQRGEAEAALAARARRVVLLTATPHAADTGGFRALCEVGRLPGEGSILVFQRNRADLGIVGTRRTLRLRVRLTPAERRMHEALDRYTSEVWHQRRDAGGGAGARLAMIVLRKRAASGPAALLASLSRRLSLLTAGRDGPEFHQIPLPLDAVEDDAAADDEPAGVLAAPGLLDPAAERVRLSRLVKLASEACAADSKLAALARFLRRAREPVIVFTEYRDTLARLASQLPVERASVMLHGGLDPAGRQSAVRAFTAGEAATLLATDAAAHGLNLQARCRLVVNVELPWMPARLEQRAGRVDRIGQRHRPHVVHLVARHTTEERVLARLVARVERERAALGRAEDPLGPLRVAELDVARYVFETPSAEGRRLLPRDGDGTVPIRRLDLRADAEGEGRRIDALRQLSGARRRRAGGASCERSGGDSGCWTVVRRRRCLSSLPVGLLCVFVARFVDGRSSLVEETPVVLHASLEPSICHRRSLERAVPALLCRARPALVRAAASEAHKRLSELQAFARERLGGLAAREAVIGRPPGSEASPVQAGLFDRRATRVADEERLRRERDDDEAARRLDGLGSEAVVRLVGEPELALVLGVAL